MPNTRPATALIQRIHPWTRSQQISCWLIGAAFVGAGSNHLWHPSWYLAMMPPYLPSPQLLILISGVAEILGGVGLCIPLVRGWSAWGLIALLIAVFPANVHMAVQHVPFNGKAVPPLVAWLRLPAQAVFMFWVWWSALYVFRQKHIPAKN